MNGLDFRDHIERRLEYTGAGWHCLPPDLNIKGGRHVTAPDRPTGRRQDPSLELIDTHLRTDAQLLSTYSIPVYRMVEGGDEVPVVVVTASDEPRRGRAEDEMYQHARTAAREALDSHTSEPDPDRPNTTDEVPFWRCISESRVNELM